jgi:hypothetical protein
LFIRQIGWQQTAENHPEEQQTVVAATSLKGALREWPSGFEHDPYCEFI